MSRNNPSFVGSPTDLLITQLVDGLEPVRPLRFSNGLGFALAGLAVTIATVTVLFGIRPDVISGSFDPVFLLATGLFLLLGLASAVTVIMMSRPRVGNDHGGWIWAVAMTALLPAAAIIISFGKGAAAFTAGAAQQGLDCFMVGGVLGMMTFAVLVWWLRRGAPTSPERAGLLAGIAAGAFGIFAFSLHCASNDIVHIGLWHSSVVILGAAVGRIAIPPLVRW